MKALHPSKLNLTASILDGGTRSLYITAPHPGAGTSTCAFSFARSLGAVNPKSDFIAPVNVVNTPRLNEEKEGCVTGFSDLIQLGGKDIQLPQPSLRCVLLIDGNHGPHSLTNKLGLEGEIGMSDLLLSGGPGQISKAIHRLDEERFHFIPSGQCSLGYSLGQERDILAWLIENLKSVYKYVVYDGPPTQNNSESLANASVFDGVVMVVSSHDTRMEVAKSAKDNLTQSGANVVGAVFNRRRYYIPKWVYQLL